MGMMMTILCDVEPMMYSHYSISIMILIFIFLTNSTVRPCFLKALGNEGGEW